MKQKVLVIALFAVVACGLTSCSGSNVAATGGRMATVTLRDGSHLSGNLTSSSATEIKLAGTDGSSHLLPMDQVRSIEYADTPVEAKVQPATIATATTGNSPPAVPHVDHYHPTEAAISTKSYRLPEGTRLSVRVEDTIDSRTAVDGQTYPAELTNDVTDADGNVVIPRGSNAQIVIKSASRGGKIQGQSDLVLDLQSISIGGRRYGVDTVDLERRGHSGVGLNKRTATYSGTGAAIGAIIGAIAGGGKAAAIGAASGAGAGVVTQTVTRGDSIRIPVETILTFQLDSPLRIVAR